MTGVFTSQVADNAAGRLDAFGGGGGVVALAALAQNRAQPCRLAGATLTVFTPATCTPASRPTMTLFDAWSDTATGNTLSPARAAVARGQAVFNGGVQLHVPGVGVASCSTCHALNNVGNNPSDTSPLSFVRLGLDSPDFLAQLAVNDAQIDSFVTRTAGLPVYSVVGGTCPTLSDPLSSSPIVGTNLRTTDPGRAMVTGHCADLGKFKPPVLRDVAVRAPYFHNAAATTLDDVVNFYNARFTIGLSEGQHADLVAFLKTL
jgi:cytochrome c peroxidase